MSSGTTSRLRSRLVWGPRVPGGRGGSAGGAGGGPPGWREKPFGGGGPHSGVGPDPGGHRRPSLKRPARRAVPACPGATPITHLKRELHKGDTRPKRGPV